MLIKDQVCTVWQGKALKEMGFKLKPNFVYVAYDKEFQGDEEPNLSNGYIPKEFVWAPAYTVAELFEIIRSNPDIKYRTRLHHDIQVLVRNGGNYDTAYSAFDLAELIISFSDNPEH